MKRILYLSLVIFTLSLFTTSCQNDKPAQNPKPELRKKQQQRKANQKKKQNQKKANQQKKTKPALKPKRLPKISQLKKANIQTQAAIKTINENKVAKGKQPFRLTGKNIVIKGMAIDKPRKTAAAGVYVKIGNQFFETNYGQNQRAFADRSKNPKYLKSGFTITIPKAKIKNGDYDVSLCVVSSDRKTYYETEKKVKVKIR